MKIDGKVHCFFEQSGTFKEPTNGFTHQQTPADKILTHDDLRGGIRAGICSEERSMISPDYARNFICDFIIGKVQYDVGEPQLDFGDIV